MNDVRYLVLADGRIAVSHKQCTRCERVLPLEEFASNRSEVRVNRSAVRSQCRACCAFVREQKYLASLGFINLLTQEKAS